MQHHRPGYDHCFDRVQSLGYARLGEIRLRYRRGRRGTSSAGVVRDNVGDARQS
jgi:hypothetical protein